MRTLNTPCAIIQGIREYLKILKIIDNRMPNVKKYPKYVIIVVIGTKNGGV